MRWRSVPVAAAALMLTADHAGAHAFGARYDLPLPLHLYLVAAGLAVAASFGAAHLFLRRKTTEVIGVTVPFPAGIAQASGLTLRLAGVLIFSVLVTAGLVGAPAAVDNLATVTVWVLWWVGFLLFTALVVDLWPLIDPFRTAHAGLAHVLGRDPEHGFAPLPPAAGYLAPLSLLIIAWIELVSDWSEDPRAIAAMMGIYLVVSLTAGQIFGAAWFREADPLGRVFATLGRVAPLAVTSTGLRLRPPGEGLLADDPPPRGEAALAVGLIGIVLFDGLSETPAWAAVLEFVSESQTLRPGLLALRAEGVDLMKAIRSVGLVVTVAAFLLAWLALIRVMRAIVGEGPGTRRLAALFAGSLLPIAAAYHLSHYISYLVMAGQLAIPAASDPFDQGWNLFGGAGRSIDVSVMGARHVWWIAFVALIVGHSLSVLAGHRRALQIFGDPRVAARSQIPMTVAMVGLTVLSLWILSQPIVN